jgi:hypothetical protein
MAPKRAKTVYVLFQNTSIKFFLQNNEKNQPEGQANGRIKDYLKKEKPYKEINS